jgi:hypothetical protein
MGEIKDLGLTEDHCNSNGYQTELQSERYPVDDYHGEL